MLGYFLNTSEKYKLLKMMHDYTILNAMDKLMSNKTCSKRVCVVENSYNAEDSDLVLSFIDELTATPLNTIMGDNSKTGYFMLSMVPSNLSMKAIEEVTKQLNLE